jgi:hypothetical protein
MYSPVSRQKLKISTLRKLRKLRKLFSCFAFNFNLNLRLYAMGVILVWTSVAMVCAVINEGSNACP